MMKRLLQATRTAASVCKWTPDQPKSKILLWLNMIMAEYHQLPIQQHLYAHRMHMICIQMTWMMLDMAEHDEETLASHQDCSVWMHTACDVNILKDRLCLMWPSMIYAYS